MVEAVGVEPTSEKEQISLSTYIVVFKMHTTQKTTKQNNVLSNKILVNLFERRCTSFPLDDAYLKPVGKF